jgi:hypothetical protein
MGEAVRRQGETTAARLAECLQERGYRAQLIERLTGPVRLKVTNPAATALTETVTVHAGAFWWSWLDQIGPEADVPGAADRIARVLAASDDRA